jgi:signal transduction histidine kinase/CheY-like chemotaxis protein
MRLSPTVAAVPLLLLLLTWLSFQAFNADAELFDRALGELDRFTMLESALQRDVLGARIGLLRNYDPLVIETNALDASVLRLRKVAAVDAETALSTDRLTASVANQDVLVERFKSNDALLHNSLAYFGLYSNSLGAPDRTGPIGPAVGGLAASMLRLTLDTSPATADEVERWLDKLASQPIPPEDANAVRALLAHGRMIQGLLPAAHGVLKALLAEPRKRDRDALRTMLLTRQSASRGTARGFRLLLYVVSLVLVAILVHLGLRLRARALTLRRRAAFEHAIARISTRFINAQPTDITAHIEHALAELANHVGADRAYFVASAEPTQRYVWGRKGVCYPPDWPDQAPDIASRFRPTTEGIIHIPSIDRLPLGRDKETFGSLGLHAWVCARIPSADAGVVILGFDAMQDGPISRHGEFGLLRMALDAVANAVRRSHLQQQTARLEQRLQQSRRIETVGALTSGIAHNFNNIIAAILGYAEIAEAQVLYDSVSAQNIIEIRRAGERARDLIDQILAFGRRRDVRREPVRLSDLITEAASLLRFSLPPGIDLAIEGTSEPATIFGERGQLQQVIVNLCNNAAQAMDGSGCIKLDAEVREIAQARPLSHGDLPPGRYVCISVSDSGRGMDTATLDRIFEPFFTTRLAGNGLGLATVQEIVREHRGALNVRSTPGVGSRFEAWLPCTATGASTSRIERSTFSLGCGETVLIVDEEREQLLKDEETIAALGYEPVGFTRADDALMAIRDAPKRFDVSVVGNLQLASSTLEFTAALHAINPNLPILLASAGANEIGAGALVAAGISDVVLRPIIATEMAAALAGCLALTRVEPNPQALGSSGVLDPPEKSRDTP